MSLVEKFYKLWTDDKHCLMYIWITYQEN